VAHNRYRERKGDVIKIVSLQNTIAFVRIFSFSTHLPSSNTGDDEEKGEGDHGKSHQDTHFEQVISERSLVLAVDDGKWLRTERISHGCIVLTLPPNFRSIELQCCEKDVVLFAKK
jgi:hypothetical protein